MAKGQSTDKSAVKKATKTFNSKASSDTKTKKNVASGQKQGGKKNAKGTF